MRKYTIKDLEEKNLIIFSAVMGSHAYGTALPTSDTDIRGVFIQPLEDILGFGRIDQVADKSNDIIYYEIGRFLELVQSNNPNILELLNCPEDCIQYKDSIFDLVLAQKDKFISKVCKNSFAGYAIGQIKKARGYNKKINWEETAMVRKNVLDFCYILEDNGTVKLNKWIEKYNQSFIGAQNYNRSAACFGLAKVDHAHDIYAMYDLFHHIPNMDFIPMGIVSDPQKANDVQLVSIPKEDLDHFVGYLTFNKDAYSTHCKRYKEYQTWLKERNEDRFKMNKEHGKNYDSKNLMHTFRLLSMATEIAKGEINVRRSPEEIKTLMKIRKGEYDYDQLLEEAEAMIKNLDDIFDKSNLPDNVDRDFVNNLLIQIRKERYK